MMSKEVSIVSKETGRPIFEIIEAIRNGNLMGHKEGDWWFVDEEGVSEYIADQVPKPNLVANGTQSKAKPWKYVAFGVLALWVVVGEFQAQKIDSLAGIKATECIREGQSRGSMLAAGVAAMTMDPFSQMYVKVRNSIVKQCR